MVTYNFHIISLVEGISPADVLAVLRRQNIKPLVKAKVVRWIILPKEMSKIPLLAYNIHWDMLLILPGESELPLEARSFVKHSWSGNIGVGSSLMQGYEERNAKLLRPPPGSVKPAESYLKPISESSQGLSLSAELSQWVSNLEDERRKHPVSMLNLLKFAPNKRQQYKKYGQEFAKRVGSRHGGVAKIVAHVVGGQAKEQGWDEIAFAHYPSIEHFAAMSGSEDYQEVNKTYRQGALVDTFILCTQEIDDDGKLAGYVSSSSKI
ncbi:hypothetical protein BT63DRAFT_374439 [Microthyrium microscopicum]|uniref:DUF1330 domain-containing protein n=1 Tax=Microthyrium microscopicum TaxID=703497 RepID=A0A6A6U9B0_9PEZI|nr:hypothetical protein BT63DRAFT_374439 [Microthyrium microscopicum]